MDKMNIGIVGLGVMGSNLALNIERNGFTVVGYDVDVEKVQAFLQSAGIEKKISGVKSLKELISVLEKPRRIMIMVPAGNLVDSVISDLKPYLEPGDILIDGGNSFFLDTERRNKVLEEEGFNYIGAGISGGEAGALWGPSIMPGGHFAAWELVSPIFRTIAAKADDGKPCVTYIGPRGAGHYVKMVHNGIEYGDMQLIAEAYDILHRGLGIGTIELSEIFAEWNRSELKSYLIEITAQILSKKDDFTNRNLVEMILDEAQQKGTGKWASQNAFDVGSPIPTINAAVESRIISSLKKERIYASRVLPGSKIEYKGNKNELINAARDALYLSKITSYAQGLSLLQSASKEYEYDLNLAEIAQIWRAGCIIRASLLNEIMEAYARKPDLVNLLMDDSIQSVFESRLPAWRKVVCTAVELGIPSLATSSSLAYYDAYRSEYLPANLIQAQRDFFGAHTYRRLDRDGVFHTNWSGE